MFGQETECVRGKLLKMKRKVRILLLVLIPTILVLGCINQESEKPEEALSVSELLKNPVYDTEVKVYGKISALGELLCPCFALTSDGKMLEVWYDLMVEDDRTQRPAVSVEGIENGDWVTVTGELKSNTGTALSTTFWASSIEKIIGKNEVANVNDIEIMLLESFPVQVHVVARGEHPDSCTEVDKIRRDVKEIHSSLL